MGLFSKIFSRLIFSMTGTDGFERRYFNFTGIAIESLSYDEMISRIDTWLKNKEGRSHHIACLNAYCVALSMEDERLSKIYNSSDIAGPDGMPFVRWLRTMIQSRCDRFCAPDIALYLAEKSKEKGYSFYLYGGSPTVLENMQAFLKEKFPHINIAGSMSPPFRALTQEEEDDICGEINRLKPDIVLVGLGTPKQDYWIEEHIEKIRGAVFVASGATFDFFGGRINMAPHWIRISGFEWLYRLLGKDFKRLWKRYTYYNYVFLSRFVLQLTGIATMPIKRTFHN